MAKSFKEEQLEIAKDQLLTDDWQVFDEVACYRISREYWMNAYLDIEIYNDEVRRYLQARLWDGTRWPVYLKRRKDDWLFQLNYWDIQWELESKAYDRDIFKK